jgi:hypothetical protein
MKKVMIVFGIVALLGAAAWSASVKKTTAGSPSASKTLSTKNATLKKAAPQGLHFVSLTLGPTFNGCSRYHHVTMFNNSTQAIAANQYVTNYWSRTSASEPWAIYYGSGFNHEFAPGETKSFDIPFFIPLHVSDIRVTVSPDHSLNSPIVCEASAPTTYIPLDQVVLTGQYTATGWTVTIANNSTWYFCTDNITTYKATAAAPTTWVPCGGTVPPAEVGPGKQASTPAVNPGAGWKTGYKYFKVMLFYGNVVYLERVLDMGN